MQPTQSLSNGFGITLIACVRNGKCHTVLDPSTENEWIETLEDTAVANVH